jgi:hypothetical protein
MRRKKRSLFSLIGVLLSLGLLTILILFVAPNSSVSIGIITISTLWIFLLAVAIFCYSLPLFALKSKKHGILLSIFVITYFIFRLNGLSHPLFLIILIGLLLTLELLFTSKHT